MDLQAEKYALIEYITQIKEAGIINQIKSIIKSNEMDFWDDLSEKEKKEVKQGMDELNKGEKTDYEDFISKHR